jgi:hypothetical protein
MKTATEIQSELGQFYGTEGYVRWSPLFRNCLLTDGAHFIAESCGAYWLMDAIASYLPKAKNDGMMFAELKVKDNSATLTLHDGRKPRKVYATQVIEYTDFPLPEITIWAEYDGEKWVLLLPSEH